MSTSSARSAGATTRSRRSRSKRYPAGREWSTTLLIINGRCALTSQASVSDFSAVEDGDAAPADDLHDVIRADYRGGVLVDAQAEQRRVGRDDRKQAAQPGTLLEVLIDDQAGQDGQSGSHLEHALPGCRAAGAECDHMRAHRGGARARAGDHGAFAVTARKSPADARAGDRQRQAQLVAAGQKDARGVAHGAHGARIVGLLARRRVDGRHPTYAQFTEDAPVHVAGHGAQRRGAADHRDARVGAAGQLYEARQDDALADLVLCPANDNDVSRSHFAEYATRDRRPVVRHRPLRLAPRPYDVARAGAPNEFGRGGRAKPRPYALINFPAMSCDR